MAERFSEIEKSSGRETSLEERLKEYPELKAKIETILPAKWMLTYSRFVARSNTIAAPEMAGHRSSRSSNRT